MSLRYPHIHIATSSFCEIPCSYCFRGPYIYISYTVDIFFPMYRFPTDFPMLIVNHLENTQKRGTSANPGVSQTPSTDWGYQFSMEKLGTWKFQDTYHLWLVVFRPTPLKTDGVRTSWDDDIPNIWKVINIMFQTTNQFWLSGFKRYKWH